MSVRDTVYSIFRDVAEAQGRVLAPLTDDLRLADSGLDSLSFAIVVASLEDALNADPFSSAEWVAFPTTLRDFIHLYDVALA
jgi:hypothetical protein